MKSALIDTGPLYSFFDSSDKHAKPVREFLRGYKGQLVTTLAIVTEVSYLLGDIKPAQLDFIEWIQKGAVEIEDVKIEDFAEIHKGMTKYADTPMDFADATLVFIANKLKIPNIITLDDDFRVYRLAGNSKFIYLL